MGGQAAAAAGAVLGGVGSAVSAGWGLTGAIGGIIQNYKNRVLNEELAREQIALQKEQMQREDTAVQRRAADLEAAGINPLLAGNWNGGADSQIMPLTNGTINTPFGDTSGAVAAGNTITGFGKELIEMQQSREQIKSNETIAQAEHQIQESNAISNKLNAEANKLTAAVNAKYTHSKNNREEKQFYQSVLNFNTEMNLQNAELEQRKAEHLSKIQNEKARLEAENNWKIAENIINTAKNEIMKSATEAEWNKINNEDYINRKKVELDKMKIEMEKKMAVSSEARNWVNAVWGQTLNTVGLVLTGGFSSVTHNYGDTNHYGTEYRAGTINQNSQGTFNNGK